MAKLIKQIHDLVDIAIDKGYTNYLSRPQIDATIYAGLVELFRTMLTEHPKTLRSRNYLLPFQKTASIALTAGIGPVPSDFEHEIEFFLDDADKTHIPIVERGFWTDRRRDPINPPSATSPVGTIYLDTIKKIEIAPTTLTSIKVLYFKTPVMPSYKTTINVDDQEVYDDTTSIDIEFSPLLHDIVMEKALSTIGLALQRGEVVRQSQMSIPKESKT
jgi:hypothetical protein